MGVIYYYFVITTLGEPQFVTPEDFQKIPQDDLLYNAQLLVEAGFITQPPNFPSHMITLAETFSINDLTWEGQEFLDSIKDNQVWSQVKSDLSNKGLDVGIDIVKSLATGYVKKKLGLE